MIYVRHGSRAGNIRKKSTYTHTVARHTETQIHTTHAYIPYVHYLITHCVDLILIQLRHHVVFRGNNKTVPDVQHSTFSDTHIMKKMKKIIMCTEQLCPRTFRFPFIGIARGTTFICTRTPSTPSQSSRTRRRTPF